MTNRQLAALETKKNLLATAKTLIRKKGLVNTSVGEITSACGVSSGTFYTYFKRKEDIVFAISLDIFQDIFEEAQSHSGPFLERLIFFLTNFSGHIEKDGLKLCQEWVRNTVDPDLVENPEDREKLYSDIAWIQGLFEQGVERGELKADTPAELLACTLTDILYGEMLCWDMSGGAYSFEARTKEFCEHFLAAMIAPYLKGKDA